MYLIKREFRHSFKSYQSQTGTQLYDTLLFLLVLLWLTRMNYDRVVFSVVLLCSFFVTVKGMKYSSKIWRRNLRSSEKSWSVYNRSSRKLRACLLAKPNQSSSWHTGQFNERSLICSSATLDWIKSTSIFFLVTIKFVFHVYFSSCLFWGRFKVFVQKQHEHL